MLAMIAVFAAPWYMLDGSSNYGDLAGFALTFLAMAVSIWAFVRRVRWFHAVHDVAVQRGRARFRGAWWFWAWVIPIVSPILPYLMVKDLWNAGERPGTERPLPALLNRWWACWVVLEVMGYLNRGDSLDGHWPVIWIVYCAAWVLGILLAFPVVGRLTDHAIAIRTDQSDGVEPPSIATTLPVT